VTVVRHNPARYECRLWRLEQARNRLEKAFKLGDPKHVKEMVPDDPDLDPLRKEIGILNLHHRAYCCATELPPLASSAERHRVSVYPNSGAAQSRVYFVAPAEVEVLAGTGRTSKSENSTRDISPRALAALP
jgi:hypothetical protein